MAHLAHFCRQIRYFIRTSTEILDITYRFALDNIEML